MRNKKIKSILSLGLAGMLLLSACGSSEASNNSSDTAKESTSQAAESSTDATETDAVAEEPITLTIMTTMNEASWRPDESMYTAYIEEKFNVNLEFMYVDSSDFATQFNLMLESGDYPDIISGNITSTQVKAAAEVDALLPLNDYIANDSYYQQVLDTYSDYEQYLTAPDGNIYTFFVRSEAVHQNALYKMFYRKEWLDTLGWDHEPETTEEFKQFLIDIRDKDVNGNGDPNDEIPFMSYNANGGTTDPIGFLMCPFELYNEEYYRITDDNEIYFEANTDGFRKGLAYIADLYAEGLIAEETYTNDISTAASYVNQEPAVIGSFTDWYRPQLIDGNVQSWFTYEPLSPLKGDYQQTAARRGGVSLTLNSAITTACENPEKAFEIYDWMCSEEACWIYLFGFEGITYEWVDEENFNGTTPAVSLIPQESDTPVHWLSGAYPRFETAEKRYSIIKPTEDTTNGDNTSILVQAAEKYEDYHVSINLPWVIWADDETTAAYNEYYTLFDTYINNVTTEFIMGIRDINDDNAWQDYLDELNDMGLEEYISVLEKYYGLK